MLKINKNITLNGEVHIEDKTVAYISANISEKGTITVNKNIVLREIYNENEEVVRECFKEFETEVYKIEESLKVEVIEQ